MAFVISTGEKLPRDRRRSPRRVAHATCGLRDGKGAQSSVTVWNISEGGFGAECGPMHQPGDEVTFRLGRVGQAPARIVWRIGSAVGAEFLRKVSAAEIALTLATASPGAKRAEDGGTAV